MGWTNIHQQPIINFMITNPQPIFWNVLEPKKNSYTGEYIAKQFDIVIKEIGPIDWWNGFQQEVPVLTNGQKLNNDNINKEELENLDEIIVIEESEKSNIEH
ncbi:hypothetical protein RhiirA4_429900 [Rhizophagus irregularis]|uniref:Uncharacterized protein n=1 Tax=Rhizophagus irregularis TaxID=588596 RepID=A0A2I1HII6_9GLOM|nr:hypothetical protein RhiirA4_429900 [Rhizophagus irregularis]